MKKEPKPIPAILQAWEVRAYLAGTLSLLIRPVVGRAAFGNMVAQPVFLEDAAEDGDRWSFMEWDATGEPSHWIEATLAPITERLVKLNPLGKPGGKLWIRETWCLFGAAGSHVGFKATDEDGLHEPEYRYSGWHSPVTLRRGWARPERPEVVSGQVVRLHDLTEQDAKAMGITTVWPLNPDCGELVKLWNASFGKEAGLAWDDNPFVWVTGVAPLTERAAK